jgi:transposase
MPFLYRVTLTEEQFQELKQRTHEPGLAPSTRDRLEMVRLSDTGCSVPQIAGYLGQHEQTVRFWIKRFLDAGFDGLINKARGGKHSALTPAMLEMLRQEITRSQRTWSAAQIATWMVEQYQVHLSAGRVRHHLKRAGLSYQRSHRSVCHKQDPAQVAQKKAALEVLEKRGSAA